MSVVRVPEVGFQLLIAQLAAESNPLVVSTEPQPEELHVTDEVTNQDGTTGVRHRLLTPTERRELAEMSNAYLIDAGASPVPPDQSVLLTLPAGVPDMNALCRLLLENIGDRPTDHPSQMAAALREVIPSLYR